MNEPTQIEQAFRQMCAVVNETSEELQRKVDAFLTGIAAALRRDDDD